jgi:hypothetical protein
MSHKSKLDFTSIKICCGRMRKGVNRRIDGRSKDNIPPFPQNDITTINNQDSSLSLPRVNRRARNKTELLCPP